MPIFNADSVLKQVELDIQRGNLEHARVYLAFLRRQGWTEQAERAEELLIAEGYAD